MNRVLSIIEKYIGVLTVPITRQFPMFMVSILLMILPTLLNAYWLNNESLDWLCIMRMNKYGAGIPYMFFFPFLISFVCCSLQVIVGGRCVKILVYTILTVLCVVNVFLLFNYGTILTPWIYTLIMETNASEATEFIMHYGFSNGSIFAYIMLALLFVLILLAEQKREWMEHKLNNPLVCLLFFIISMYLAIRGVQNVNTFTKVFDCETTDDLEGVGNLFKFGSNTISSLVFVLCDYKSHKSEIDIIIRHTQETALSSCQLSSSDSLTVILVIGESYNKYHSGLYGYNYNTTPFLSAEREAGRLFVFNDVVSPYNMTSFAMKNIFSCNVLAKGERWYSKPLFPAVFKKSGYHVYFWDNQFSSFQADVSDFTLNTVIHNRSISQLCYHVYNTKTYQYDGDFVRSFDSQIPLKGCRNLVIFHLMGQHFMAAMRYPDHAPFRKLGSKDVKRLDLSESQREDVAEYDNATLYNDRVLRDIIFKFKNSNAVLVYLSDHGEEHYDYRDYSGRTFEKGKSKSVGILKYQYEVPFVIWCSEKYKERNPENINAMRQCLNVPFMTDIVYNLLFRLGNIKTDYYQPCYDILSPEYVAEKRIVADDTDYDKVMKYDISISP